MGLMGLPTLTAKIAFSTNPAATPVYTDVTEDVRRGQITRGRSHELDRVEAGRCKIRLRNREGQYDPSFTTGPFYPNVLPMRRLVVQATWLGVTYDRFNGYIERWPQTWTRGPQGDAYVEIEAVDGFKVLALANVNTTRSAELSGTRVNAILDAVGWPSADRSIDAGLSTVQGVTLVDEPALTHLQEVATTEGGLLFMSRDGKVTFRDRTRIVTDPLDTTNLTWGDSGTERGYVEVGTSFDDSQIWNDAKITAPGKTDQVASNATSQTRYFRRTKVESGLWNDQNEMDSRADYIVTRYGEPSLRMTNMVLDPRGDDEQWPYILSRDIHDKVRVRKRPIGGNLIEQDSFVEGLGESFDKHAYLFNVNLSPLDRVADYFIWDESRWDIDTRWFY